MPIIATLKRLRHEFESDLDYSVRTCIKKKEGKKGREEGMQAEGRKRGREGEREGGTEGTGNRRSPLDMMKPRPREVGPENRLVE